METLAEICATDERSTLPLSTSTTVGAESAPNFNLASFVLEDAAKYGDKLALIDGNSGESLTYNELALRVKRLAGGLAREGFGPGQVLALMAPNCPDFAVVFHATVYAGGAITTINPSYTVSEVHHQLVDSGATMAVVGLHSLPVFQEAAAGTSVRLIVGLGGGSEDVSSLETLYAEPIAQPCPVDPAQSVAALPYSSGTTGTSKGVMLTHGNLMANLQQVAPRLAFADDECVVAALPLFHIYGMNALMNPALRAGATIVTMARFDLTRFLQLSAEYAVRRCFVVPPIAVLLAYDPQVDAHDLSALRLIISGAAPLSAELSRACAQRMCCTVTQGYGMTELSPVSHFAGWGQEREGSVGPAVDGTEVRIADLESGAELPHGAEGELWVRGPQVMKGYLNNEQATAATITPDGWLRTGDIARQDTDGYLYVVDRLKELIKFKGFQIAPAELEAVLLSHPDIADAAVIGQPDAEAGEHPVAFVVARSVPPPSVEAIEWHMSQRLAKYKQLHRVHFVTSIPRSPSGKVLRRVLREQPLAP